MTPQTPYVVSGDAGTEPAGAPEIEVTPEMIAAGVNLLANYDSRETFPAEQAELVAEIYRAMITAGPKPAVLQRPFG